MQVGDRFHHGPVEYEVVKQEGEGGFSIVFKATPVDPASKSPPLAAKVLQPQYATEEEWQKRFERESRVLGNIDHPNVVKIRATYREANGSLVILQDFIEGAVSMREYFRKHSADTSRHLSVVLQVLYGLRATHGLEPNTGAIHHDVSPNNVLIDPTGAVKLIDFGLARPNPRGPTVLTTQRNPYGTPGCVSPEQFVDPKSADHLSDLFGLGRTLAASLQDREPQHVDCAALPEPWRSICLALTDHDRTKRPPNCDAAIAMVLEKFAPLGFPTDMAFHLAEMRTRPTLVGWAAMSRKYFDTTKGSTAYERYAVARLIGETTLEHPEFQIDTAFDDLEANVIEPIFGGGFSASFESTDGLGELLAVWLPRLDADRRQVAFARLVRTAFHYNRYSLMGSVRVLYQREQDPDVKNSFLVILEDEDPFHVIEGRGFIPGR